MTNEQATKRNRLLTYFDMDDRECAVMLRMLDDPESLHNRPESQERRALIKSEKQLPVPTDTQ